MFASGAQAQLGPDRHSCSLLRLQACNLCAHEWRSICTYLSGWGVACGFSSFSTRMFGFLTRQTVGVLFAFRGTPFRRTDPKAWAKLWSRAIGPFRELLKGSKETSGGRVPRPEKKRKVRPGWLWPWAFQNPNRLAPSEHPIQSNH